MTVGDYSVSLTTSGGWLAAFLFLVVSVLAFRAYRPLREANRLHQILFGVRQFAVLLASLLILAPQVTLTVQGVRLPLVAVLIDDSESMRILAGEQSRHEALDGLLSSGVFESLEGRARLATFRFSEQLLDPDPADTTRWSGTATDIATSLDQLSSRLKGEGLTGVFLLSDGAHNVGESPLHTAEAYNAPIYTVPVGAGKSPRDIAVTSVTHPSLGYAGRLLKLAVSLEVVGIERAEQSIRVYDGERVVATRAAALAPGKQTLELAYTPEQAGNRTLRVVVAPVEGEAESQNNQVLTTIEVLAGRARVLVVGTPSPDLAYLLRVVRSDSNVVVYAVVPESGQGWGFGAQRALVEASAYSLVVLHDIPGALLTEEATGAIAAMVQAGGGLLVVGGESTLTPGWAGGLGEALPVRPGSSGYQPSFTPLRVASSDRHPIVQLTDDPVADREAWLSLPPFVASVDVEPVSGARVLIKDPEGKALAAVRQVGAGKSAVVAARGVARQELMMWGIGASDAVNHTFWSQMIRWLLTKTEIQKLRVQNEKSAYRSGEPIVIRAEYFDDLLRPVDGAEVLIDVDGGSRGALPMPGRGDGAYEARIPGMSQGEHGYKVTAVPDNGAPITIEGKFTVGRYSVEYEQLLADERLLQEVAERSGGKLVAPWEVAAFLGDMQLSPQPHLSTHRLTLWGHRWPLVVLFIVLAAEWFVRRRRGMI
ncbi:TPA: hypothetical protein DCE37_01520 [Candidatus Latescibacteria bacterium]|nr:hypothetical protein [Candidatus Latescibacterota bacterium]